MKRNYKILASIGLIVILIANLSGCATSSGVQALSNKSFLVDYNSEVATQSIDGLNSLGYRVVKDYQANEFSNMIFSPVSLACALAMLSNGAEAETQQEILEALGDNSQINENYLSLINQLDRDDEHEKISISNSLWFKKGRVIKDQFADNLKEYFDADSFLVDFNSSTKKDINNYIATKTNNMLKDTIKQINPQTVAMLINTLYFKATWDEKFEENDTYKQQFTLSNGEKKDVEMMHGMFFTKYYEDESCQILKLNYQNTAMYVILPTNSLADFIESDSYTDFDIKIKDMTEENVRVSLPKFKTRSRVDLIGYLQKAGIKRAFDSSTAQFTAITDSNLVVSKVFQDATIEVGEEGTEAAAATVIEMVESCPLVEVNKEFKCDKPFLYVIREENTGANLFMGVVSDPSE